MAFKKDKSDWEEALIKNVRVPVRDCSEEMQEFIITTAQQVIKNYYKGEYKYWYEVAKQLKKEVTEKYPGAWHCIVGSSFGSFVTHESKQ